MKRLFFNNRLGVYLGRYPRFQFHVGVYYIFIKLGWLWVDKRRFK